MMRRKWSKNDVKFLRKNYSKNQNTWIARMLGRTLDAVKAKAYKLCLYKQAPKVTRRERLW